MRPAASSSSCPRALAAWPCPTAPWGPGVADVAGTWGGSSGVPGCRRKPTLPTKASSHIHRRENQPARMDEPSGRTIGEPRPCGSSTSVREPSGSTFGPSYLETAGVRQRVRAPSAAWGGDIAFEVLSCGDDDGHRGRLRSQRHRDRKRVASPGRCENFNSRRTSAATRPGTRSRSQAASPEPRAPSPALPVPLCLVPAATDLLIGTGTTVRRAGAGVPCPTWQVANNRRLVGRPTSWEDPALTPEPAGRRHPTPALHHHLRRARLALLIPPSARAGMTARASADCCPHRCPHAGTKTRS